MSVREITKRGETRWIAEVYLDGKRVRRFFTNEDEARRGEVRILEGIDGPDRRKRPSMQRPARATSTTLTLEQFVPRFMKNYVRVKNKPSEYDSKESKFRVHLLPAFGSLPLNQITAAVVADYIGDLVDQDELKPKTINNVLTTLNTALKKAVEWGDLESAPAIPWLDVDRDEEDFRFLGFADARALLEVADEPMWGDMILVAMKTGLRLGELRGLRCRDVDLKRKALRVRQAAYKNEIGSPKTKSSKREVPLADSVAKALQRQMKRGHQLVFARDDGSLLTKEQCKWPLWRACERAGLERMGWHVLRHTFASHLAMRRRTLKEIQELLGHTSIKMTLRYAHLSPEVKREAVAVLDD